LSADSADVVLMNPPFNDSRRHRVSPDAARKTAHVATAATLEHWIGAARRILKSGGVVSLIWRADALSEVLAALEHGFGSLAILPVHGEAEKPAIRVLIRAIKGGRAPSRIYTALILNDESAPTERVQEILSGKGSLPLAGP
jgi:tRNA1(Val) A37 N6-methylase TrmN6